ncbi:LacI family DNA-binding transcriptional regulator [Paenibacillus thalictri]|uniref:LacI family transcriptional regulator n=1 Tax=Paenibacillus thalictri TaxID=2527873 RepID=A0A4Q9DST7_9BACL|nr:LacI family DNA-binding transcriptional regulator [Paenibacillus thalictri]TBL79035.1 LacI family transcriptional regulator [Paenibacillus thalictri]
MKKIDLRSQEIAEIAGVSRSTVSRVINNYANVPPKTREKVLKVIEQYGYTPNISARTLAGKKTKIIGLFFIDQWQFSKDSSANMLITGVIESAAAMGYIVLTTVVRDLKNPESMKNVKEMFYQSSITAGIFIGAENHEPVIEELISEGFIIGVLDQVLPGRNEPNRIVYNLNNEAVARKAVDYLYGLNHTRIGIINGDLKKAPANFKFKGFLSQMEHHGLDVNKAWIMHGNYEAGSYEAMTNLLANSSDLPTAIFAVSDSLAFGAIRAINDFSLKVPDDISVIGMNDQPLSAYYKPALTTFRVNYDQLTAGVTQNVIRTVENGVTGDSVISTLDCTLIERESCKKI